MINAATVQAVLGSTFRITGLSSPQEASELALMLRAGALAAPMYFVEERVVGPSLGQENIDKGVLSTQIGFLACCNLDGRVLPSIWFNRELCTCI